MGEALESVADGRFDGAFDDPGTLDALGALGERIVAALEAGSAGGRQAPAAADESRSSHQHDAELWLDAVRRPAVLRRIVAVGAVDLWMARILRVLDGARFTVASLLTQRAERYGPRTLFRESVRGREVSHSWIEVITRVDQLACGFIALKDKHGAAPIAVLSENRFEVALVDLACLSTGLVNLMIPAATTEVDVAYILAQAEAGTAVVSSEEQLRKVERHRRELPALQTIVLMDRGTAPESGVLSLAELAALGRPVTHERLAGERGAVDPRALATVMYTSGTTGRPKGICFSQRNIVSKRFARALALPEIGDHDVFLCFLPLFHTFGRYFELMGCVFWGATYVFLEDPSLDTLRETMRRVRPTVFISVPKKWMQLWEEIGRRADFESDSDETLRAATRELVGDRLRWGLSAAGYLAPEIFRFFQSQGVELLSGFGMTEATGGITMTPVGGYRDDSLGVPLPGIEVRLDESGEMLMRGPYVMMGHFRSEEGSGVEPEGWVRTGDLMEQDEAGHFRLVDRKKEIYKNIKGESVAPQRVENLFRDFESVKRVFLVGDHKPYNTVLIVPNLDYRDVDLATMSARDLRNYYRSLVVSVNRFLAPFERIVDFAIAERDFEEAREELTPKGTYRRKVIAKNFAPVIDALYRRVRLKSADLGAEVHVPNWLFQALGLTAGDVRWDGDRLVLVPTGAELTVRRESAPGTVAETSPAPAASAARREAVEETERVLRIGSCRYVVRGRAMDLGALLACPALWLGNEELCAFAPLDASYRVRRARPPRELVLLGRVAAYEPDDAAVEVLRKAAGHSSSDLDTLDLAARMLSSTEEEHGALALLEIGQALRSEDESLLDLALLALRMAAGAPSLELRRRAFQMLLPVERDAHTPATLARFLGGLDALLDGRTIALIAEKGLSEPKLSALMTYVRVTAKAVTGGDDARERAAASMLQLLAEYGAMHPARFEPLRHVLVRVQLLAMSPAVREDAGRAAERLTHGFRGWLGPVRQIAVDPEAGEEYRWEDVVTFDEGIDEDDRLRIVKALSHTGLLREAVFLFSGEALLSLADIPPGGVWVSLLGSKHGKSVYRVTAHTRTQGSFDLALNLNRDQSADELLGEMRWLIVAGGPDSRAALVEKFGGYWEEYDLWSEEFIAGETLDRVVSRLARHTEGDPIDRLRMLWPFFVASAAEAFVEFWNRTGRRYVLAEPSAGDVIVPTHDYQTGTRVVSISERCPAPAVATMLDDLWTHLVLPMEAKHPSLSGVAPPDLILSAFVEALGVKEALDSLRDAAGAGPVSARIADHARRVQEDGFVPRRLFSAIDRYHRWAVLAPEAPPAAHAQTARELSDTYHLDDLLRDYPEARVRFFRDTVFREAPAALARGLDDIIGCLRRRVLDRDDLVDRLTELRAHMASGSPEEYFLARLTYPHLQPGDDAGFLSTEMGGVRQTDIVVTLEDNQGRPYRVRQPVSPKEVGRLHRLFIAAKLDVQFRSEHHYLVAVNERGSIIGGLFYEPDEENRTAHLEKIVVAERYRKLGVGEGLMNEFFNRLRAGGAQTVNTGFFRPSYFYRFGFVVGKRQAGLVKAL
jgi:long-subunit acyl-CoA synthetase (AMP-forming)/GNAT superfamily N-acetyltransferase